MSFPRYPKYKDSGVEWLGDVPEHWDVFPLRRCLLEHRQGYYSTDSYTDTGVKLLRITDLQAFGRVEFAECPRVEDRDELKPFLLQVSDFVFARTGGAGTFGLIEAMAEPAAYASYLIRFRFSKRAQPSFLKNYFLSTSFQNAVKQNIHGGVNQNIHAEDIKNQHVAIPPTSEQTAIAAFLDREVGKIDELVGEQRRLMELLKEKRQAVISHAVTQGLSPHAPRKPSGIEWLGDIPEHWRRSQPKFFTTKIVDGVHFKPDYQADGVPFVTVQNLTAGPGISFENLNYISEEDHAQFFRRANPQRGDVLITKDGATLGVPRVIETDKVFSIFVSVALLKPIPELIDAWFLCYALESNVVFQQFKAGEQGSALKHIHLVDLRNVFMAIPPIEEQREIVCWLDDTVRKLDSLDEEAQRAIDLLQERRTTLISAAVTGRIDVRQVTTSEAT